MRKRLKLSYLFAPLPRESERENLGTRLGFYQTLTPRLQRVGSGARDYLDPVPALIAIDTCLHCLLCYSPCAHNLAALLLLILLLCLPAAANFYIVVSQDVVTVV